MTEIVAYCLKIVDKNYMKLRVSTKTTESILWTLASMYCLRKVPLSHASFHLVKVWVNVPSLSYLHVHFHSSCVRKFLIAASLHSFIFYQHASKPISLQSKKLLLDTQIMLRHWSLEEIIL